MFQTWTDFERQHMNALKKLDEHEPVVCPKCKCKWFEEIRCAQYRADHFVALGQGLPQLTRQIPYVFLRCIKCSDILEPKISRNPSDSLSKTYDELLDKLEDKQ